MNTLTVTDIDAVHCSAIRWAEGVYDETCTHSQFHEWLDDFQCSVLRAYARRAFTRELNYLSKF